MAYWLMKTEPDEYSWEMLERDKHTTWTGVRNFEARNNIREMKPGDRVFIYHSGNDKMIMGVAEVTSDPKPDETATKGEWTSVDVKPLRSLVRPLSLEEIRNTHGLSVMPVVAHARLSVHPVTEPQAQMILKIAKTEL
jgi:predicted RNA-binding protein with PUA-like domain